MHELLRQELAGVKNAHLLTPPQLDALLPVAEYDDPAANRLAHVPYTPAYYAALGGVIARASTG